MLGVTLGATGIIAVFKPVIIGATTLPAVQRFAEQTTAVHELGHAIGLVGNGIPLTSEHHDAAHPGHCTNRDCVMYWTVESVDDVVGFAYQLQQTGSAVVFGSECLDDVDALADG